MTRRFLLISWAFALLAASARPVPACPSSLDRTFGEKGRAEDPGTNLDAGYIPLLAETGEILLPGLHLEHPAVVRYQASGFLDSTFGEGGVARAIIPGSPGGFVARIALEPDGGIVGVGQALFLDGEEEIRTPLLLRLNPDGDLDTTFGEGGFVVLPPAQGKGGLMLGVVVRSDGVIVAIRHFPRELPTGVPRGSVLYFQPDGTLDPRFGDGGVVSFPELPRNSVTTAIAVLEDDSVVISGVFPFGYERDFDSDTIVIKLLEDGTPDPSFGEDGVRHTRSYHAEVADSIATDGLGRIIVSGELEKRDGARQGLFVRRYLPDGRLDRSYGRRGRASVFFRYRISSQTPAVEPDGRVIVPTRYHDRPANLGARIVRFTVDGALDPTFGRNGVRTLGRGEETDLLSASLHGDGGIIVTGEATNSMDGEFSPFLLRLEGGDGECRAARRVPKPVASLGRGA